MFLSLCEKNMYLFPRKGDSSWGEKANSYKRPAMLCLKKGKTEAKMV